MSSEWTDFELILEARGHADGSFGVEELCRRYTPLVRAAARKYDADYREDALQEAWVALLKATATYDEHSGVSFAGYARAVVYGDVRTAMRREFRDRDRKAFDGVMGEDGESDPGSRLGQLPHPTAERAYAVADWANTWPALFRDAALSERETLALRRIMDGITSADTAKTEGVSVETVKTWRKRGLHKMRRLLASAAAYSANSGALRDK